MDLKPGYKLTEVGVIPEDWEIPELRSLIKSMKLGGNYKNSLLDTNWPLIKMGNLGRGNINLEKLEFIHSAHIPDNRDRLKEEDVLFNTRNTLDLVGKTSIWLNELPEAYFNSNIMRMEFNKDQVSSNRFMNYILNTPQKLKNLREIAIGTTSVAAIYSRDLLNLKLPLPTKAEQVAIAEVLSDADAHIESMEQLIAKKRQIKQGAMQELLTGKKRLPGFSGEWEVLIISDIFDIFAGGDVDPEKTIYYQDQTYCYPIYSNTLLNKGLYGYCSYADHQAGSITVTARGTIGSANFRDFAYTAIGRVLVLQPKRTCDGRFFSEFITNCIDFAIESTGVPQLTAPQISTYQIPVPTFSEQTAIATILSDMDTEISMLETKLAKARQIKQGMMQELLTGRIRLI